MFQFFTAVQRLIAFFQRKMLNWRMDRRTTGQTDRQIDNGGFIRPSIGRGPRKIRNLVKILLLIFINKSSRLPPPPLPLPDSYPWQLARISEASSTHPPQENESQCYSKFKIFLSSCREVWFIENSKITL